MHGEQHNRHFNTYYKVVQFLSSEYVLREKLLVSYLQPSDRGARRHATAILCLLLKQIRSHWPDVRSTFRADAGFQSALLLAWREPYKVNYMGGSVPPSWELAYDTARDN